jgi:hypothetical protein
MAGTQLRYCACGATREAPAELRILSCVRCGRALTATLDVPSPPSISLAVVATLASLLLATVALCLVVAWALNVAHDPRLAIGALLALGALWVFAGSSSLRGSLSGLGFCALLDIALALLALSSASPARGFVLPATAWIAPAIAPHVDTIFSAVGGAAALAAFTCLAALPQVRRMAAWQDAQIARIG